MEDVMQDLIVIDETLWKGYEEWLEEQAEREAYERSLWV